MSITSLAGHTGPTADEPDPIWVRQQRSLAERDAAEREQAVRALMGACLLGALDHVGDADLNRWGIGNRREVTLAQLRAVFNRGDSGLHGCGFEYAVHAAVNGSSAIPMAVRDTVLTVLSGQAQLILRDLGVPIDGWSNGLRSVMYGVERRGRSERMGELHAALGGQALLWPRAGADPVRLVDVLPLATCPPFAKRSRVSDAPRLPENLTRLWQTDLLLGGASVLPTQQVRAILGGPPYEATAWISSSLKYRSRQVKAGAGLHLGIETAFTAPGRWPLSASMREVQGMPVVTLPLDGAFVYAFNRANASLVQIMRLGLTRHMHPAYVTNSRIEDYGSWLGARRSQPVVDVAAELLSADPELFTVADRAAFEAIELLAGRARERASRRRPTVPIPQPRAS